ncbi:MAG: hypothetical protein GF331_10670 [Chitinivibrionales bacterium]|nr:hypothetical protein [Chitinivibrionales bacterium]
MSTRPTIRASERSGDAVRRRTRRVLIGIFAPVAAAVLIIGVALTWWAGYFDSVVLTERTMGPYHLLYREHRGPYEGIRFAMRDVFLYYRRLYGEAPARGFSIYYDDPANIEADSLRSIAGVLTDSLLTDPKEPYRSRTVPAHHALVGTFPLRSPFSYMIGVLKFGDVLEEYLEETEREPQGPTMEIYDLEDRVIRYVVPIED